jgi:hypothetical protein
MYAALYHRVVILSALAALAYLPAREQDGVGTNKLVIMERRHCGDVVAPEG